MCFFYCCFPIYCRILLFRFFPCFPLIVRFWVSGFFLPRRTNLGAFKYVFPPLPIPYLPSALVCVYILLSAQSILLLCRCRILVLPQNSWKKKKVYKSNPSLLIQKKKLMKGLLLIHSSYNITPSLPDLSLCMDGGGIVYFSKLLVNKRETNLY